jgi:hypothetical protein
MDTFSNKNAITNIGMAQIRAKVSLFGKSYFFNDSSRDDEYILIVDDR